MLQTIPSTAHQHGLVMLHTSNPPSSGSCSSTSTSSAASIASCASVGSEGSAPLTHHPASHQHHTMNPHHVHPQHSHSRRLSSKSMQTSANSADRHQHRQHLGTTTAEAASGGVRRQRTIRLTRPCISGSSRRVALQLSVGGVSGVRATSFGFAVRGGREYGIGFFVSRVDRGGEADVRGLRVGDQLIRVNGYAVDDAVHRELSQYVSCQDRLSLKVRGVGMLPVKDRQSDALSWHAVPGAINPAISVSHPRRLGTDEYPCQDVRITLDIEPRTKLGLGICKGPEWKPGIFVQFTKDVGVARDAGLRPGDQLLSCNGVDFADVLFSEAVAVMKASQHLEMVVRTAAGVDLFPGESSGYNSSASSVTGGDQSPCWGDPGAKRLSMVREEEAAFEKNTSSKVWDRSDIDRRMDHRLHSVQPPVVPSNYRSQQSNTSTPAPTEAAAAPASPSTSDTSKPSTNTTIIKLSETGTIINNTMVPLIADKSADRRRSVQENANFTATNHTYDQHHERGNNHVRDAGSHTRVDASNRGGNSLQMPGDVDSQVADIRFVSRKIETKTVTVEVHRGTDDVTTMPTATCATVYTSESSIPSPPPPPPPLPMLSLTPSLAEDSSHSSLQSGPLSDAANLTSAISEELKKRAERGKYQVNVSRPASAVSATADAGGRIILKKIRSAFGASGPNSEDKHNALIDEFKLAHRKMFRNASSVDESGTANSVNQQASERQLELRVFDKTPASYPDSPSPDYEDSSKKYHGGTRRHDQPPQPHHHQQELHGQQPNGVSGGGGTMGRCAAHEMAKATGDAAELESIDSYKLTNPASPPPKPPSSYFQSAATGPATLKKPARSVAVTIGEYGGSRKEAPRQFDFIANGTGTGSGVDRSSADVVDNYGGSAGVNNGGIVDVSHRLKSELESTLSRSNLRSRTDVELAFNNNAPTISTTRINAASTLVNRTISSNVSTLNGNQIFSNTVAANASRPTLHKTQSNVEKITAMLVSQNLMGSRPSVPSPSSASNVYVGNNGRGNINATSNGGTRVTINGNGNIIGANRSSTNESVVGCSPPISGILKNGNGLATPSLISSSSAAAASATSTMLEQRNISFGNITTVLTDNL